MDNPRIPNKKYRIQDFMKKTCGKTTTEMGRQHQERLFVADECKRMKETIGG
jgi:hypothetical protein